MTDALIAHSAPRIAIQRTGDSRAGAPSVMKESTMCAKRNAYVLQF